VQRLRERDVAQPQAILLECWPTKTERDPTLACEKLNVYTIVHALRAQIAVSPKVNWPILRRFAMLRRESRFVSGSKPLSMGHGRKRMPERRFSSAVWSKENGQRL
jgi:hypothetical protein